jgi:hypothetical protein
MNDKIIDLNQHKDKKHAEEKVWVNDEMLCLCGYRYIACYDYRTPLKKLECAKCRETGKIFRTGQDLTIFDNLT